MAGATPAPTQTSHVSAPPAARPSFPAGLAPVALVLAAAVGLVSLLPSLAQAVWEVPHLVLLGLVISYGVFAQRNTDAVEKTGGGNGNKDGALAWRNARYRPDEPLIVVADHAAMSDGPLHDGAMERPLSLPVRRLKQPPATEESDIAAGDASDGGVGEETDSSASSSSSALWAGAHTAPSPPSVLDADLGLSPPCSSQPQTPQPFFAHDDVASATKPRSFSAYQPCRPRDEPSSEDEGEVTDWDDEEEADDDVSDEMTVSSERSGRGNFTAACANDQYSCSDGDTSVDEELLKLASKAAVQEREDEVDRKADEFIAKFREQIRLQRL